MTITQTHKTAIVTGGSRGIGRAICLELASRGIQIAFCGRSLNANTVSLEEELRRMGVGAKAYALDAAFTRMPRLPTSLARDFVKPMIPALEAE